MAGPLRDRLTDWERLIWTGDVNVNSTPTSTDGFPWRIEYLTFVITSRLKVMLTGEEATESLEFRKVLVW